MTIKCPPSLVDQVIKSYFDKKFQPKSLTPTDSKPTVRFWLPFCNLHLRRKLNKLFKNAIPTLNQTLSFSTPKQFILSKQWLLNSANEESNLWIWPNNGMKSAQCNIAGSIFRHLLLICILLCIKKRSLKPSFDGLATVFAWMSPEFQSSCSTGS